MAREEKKTRGAFILLEGLDRSGKTTQCKLLVKHLNEQGIPAVGLKFPDRSTPIGKLLDQHLQNKIQLEPHAAHLLFVANRWEKRDEMVRLMQEEGKTLVVDRYSYSGAAFSAAKAELSLDWCLGPESGLPQPDLVLYLDMKDAVLAKREGFGAEHYETKEIQARAATYFRLLKQKDWVEIDARQPVAKVHQDILDVCQAGVRPMRTMGSALPIRTLIKSLSYLDHRDSRQPSWKDCFVLLALAASAENASMDGAVMVKNDLVLSVGHATGYGACAVYAAERAMMNAAKRGVNVDQATLYVLDHPRPRTLHVLAAAGIKHVVYLVDHRQLAEREEVRQQCQDAGIVVECYN